MSDNPNPAEPGGEQPPEAAHAPAGFEPLAPPPSVDPESVRTPQAAAEPAVTQAPPTSAPSGPDSEDIERQARLATEAAMAAVAQSAAAQKMDTLSGLVLDAAELANRSAATSTSAGTKLMEVHAALEAELAQARKHSKIVLGVAGAIAVISLGLTAAVVAQVSSRMARLDATVLAVGKRYVELTAGLESLTVLNDSLAEMQAKQEAYAALQAKLASNLEESSKTQAGLVTQLPQATAKEVQARTQALMSQVQAIDSKVQAQGAAVKKMADEVKAMQVQNENVGALKRDVEALVVLQRERYLEAARGAGVAPGAARAPAAPPPAQPRGVQYPRPQPPAPETMPVLPNPNAAPAAGR